MDFARTEEQDELAATVRGLLAKRSDSTAVRAAVETVAGYDTALWKAMCEQVGVAALAVPERYDGFGASLVETAVVLEEVGMALTPSPLLATSIATAALVAHGSEDARAELLPRLAAGEVGTLAFADRDLVLDAPAAGVLLQLRGEELVRLETAQVEPVEAMDQTLRFGRIVDAGASTRVVGTVTDAAVLPAVSTALASALQVGVMQRALDMTVCHANERVQFGRPIGSFQALKHRMSEMLVRLEASRSASWGATSAAAAYLAKPSPDHAATMVRLAAVAGSYCSEALDLVAAETVQLHGGIAITWEHDAQLVFKRAHALSQLNGAAHHHRAGLLH